MRILAIDIESTPNLADVWSLWNQNVSLNQLRQSSELLCFACKWVGNEDMLFYSQWSDGKDEMIRAAYQLLDTADAVLHYNGRHFDIPYLNKEFLLAGLTPPSPYRQIDLYSTVKKRFRFPSNKLDYVAKAMGFEGKVSHEGHELWVKVMAGNEDARTRMQEYNEQDVRLLEQMYRRLLPWIPGHPNRMLMMQGGCTACGSGNIIDRGSTYTGVSEYRTWQCLDCGKWMSETKRIFGAFLKEAAL